MLALRKTMPARGAELVTLPDITRAPGPGEAEVEIRAAGLCGSDLHAYAWDAGYAFMADLLPVTIGHEFSGIVRALGPDADADAGAGAGGLAVGDRVVCWPTLPCGICAGCRAGRPSACERRSIVGLHRDGGFTERAILPARVLHRIDPGIGFETAALAEPLAISVNAVDLSGAGPGDRVAVLGPGPIGLAAAWVAQARGAQVVLVGLGDGPRLALAREMGIAATRDLAGTTLAAILDEVFGAAPDRVIEATGAPASIEAGLDLLRPEGILVAAGIHAGSCTVDLARFVRRKIQLRGAHDTTPAAFAEALRLLGTEGAALGRMITHRLPLARGLEAFELATGKAAMKVLLLPGDEGGAAASTEGGAAACTEGGVAACNESGETA